jgi:tetratricopeptide (TPR) repeat protein
MVDAWLKAAIAGVLAALALTFFFVGTPLGLGLGAGTALAQDATARGKFRIGFQYHNRGLHAAAVRMLGEGLELDAENPEAHFYMAESLRSLGEYAEAVAHYRRSVELDPDGAKAEEARLIMEGVLDERAAITAKRAENDTRMRDQAREVMIEVEAKIGALGLRLDELAGRLDRLVATLDSRLGNLERELGIAPE